MTKYAFIYGGLLIVLGLAGYIFTGMASWTALIPAFFGVPIVLLGLWGQKQEEVAFFAMVAALVLALVGFLFTVGAIPDLIAIFREGREVTTEDVEAEELRRVAVVSRAAMAAITLGFMIQTIRQLIADRSK